MFMELLHQYYDERWQMITTGDPTQSEYSERLWVEQVASCDEAALRTAFALLTPRMEKFAERFLRYVQLNPDHAAGIVYEAWLKVGEKLSDFTWQGPGGFVAWVRVFVARLTKRLIAREFKLLDRTMPMHDELFDASPSVESQVEQNTRREDVRKATAALPEKYCQAITMRVFEEKTVCEYADLVKLEKWNAYRRYQRALDKLRTLIESEYPELCDPE